MRKKLDLDSWPRKAHFDFFNGFTDPFFGVTVVVDCTETYLEAKKENHSFYLSYLHKALVTANAIQAFRLRIHEGEVWDYERIHAAPTVDRPDQTFGYGYLDYHEDFTSFVRDALPRLEAVRQSTTLLPSASGDNVIHFSSVPWIRFTGLSHARAMAHPDCIPKISFGKMEVNAGRYTMPLSIHVHHGLADGYHVGQYLEHYQRLLENQV